MASTLQEALAQANAAGMATIDLYSRAIKLPPNISVLGVQSDDDVFRLWFTIPKMFGAVDLSTYGIRINYLNANNEGDIYAVEDATVSGDFLTFSWLVGRGACTYQGNVKFIVCFKLTDSSGEVTNEFNTAVATLPVLTGIEPGEQIVEQYPDIIEQILSRLEADEVTIESGVKSVNGKTGTVVLDAEDVGAVPSEGFEFPVTSVNGQTGAVTVAVPVTSVNGQTGAVTVNVPVTSVNGETGAVTIEVPVTSVNGQTGEVTLTAADLGAAAAATVTAINNRMLDTIAGVSRNTTTGSMELWSKNLNNYKTTGVYNAITCTNAPYQYAILEVMAYYLEGYTIQKIYDVTNACKMSYRWCIAGSWSQWYEDDIIKTLTT